MASGLPGSRSAFAESFVAWFRVVMLIETDLTIVSAISAWGLIEDKQGKE